jgi:Putative Actinobacterial Holin-X, holin superfamily III
VAFLIVGAVSGAVALVLAAFGRQRIKTVKPVPEQTVETLKENVAWARQRMS